MKSDNDFDAVVIGAGNAGLAAAGVLRAAGRSVAVIEKRDVGGTCPIRGCVPKKVLVAAAQTLDVISRAGDHRIRVSRPELDWTALIEREQSFVSGVPHDIETGLIRKGIVLKRGAARFTGPEALDVAGESLHGRHFVVATGSRPKNLPIEGFQYTITSDELLREPSLPQSLVFIGGGVIALEFGHVFARAGTGVTILEAAPRLLPALDRDAVAELTRATQAAGITVETGVEVLSIEPTTDGFAVRYRRGRDHLTARAERVANGTGREADLDGLDLAVGQVEHEGSRISVDTGLRSVSNPRVYVAGDALWSSPQLSPVATYEGQIVGRAILEGRTIAPDYRTIPFCVYSIPTLASVGLSEKEAQQHGNDLDVKVHDLRTWRSAQTYAERFAYSKILIDRATDQVVGASIVGHGGEEAINLLAFAMKHRIPATELRQTVLGYPTFSSDLRHMV